MLCFLLNHRACGYLLAISQKYGRTTLGKPARTGVATIPADIIARAGAWITTTADDEGGHEGQDSDDGCDDKDTGGDAEEGEQRLPKPQKSPHKELSLLGALRVLGWADAVLTPEQVCGTGGGTGEGCAPWGIGGTRGKDGDAWCGRAAL